jgi:hypothetical protein
MIFLGLFAIVVTALTSILRAEPSISGRAHSIQKARTSVERMMRELRVAYKVEQAGSNQLTVLTFSRNSVCGDPGAGLLPSTSPAKQCRVTYSCADSAGTVVCNRSEGPLLGTGGTTREFVRGISSRDVFTYVPNASSPDHVDIRLVFPAQIGDDAITLDDGADLRNVTPGV